GLPDVAAEFQAPEAVDDDRLARRSGELSVELPPTPRGTERVDPAISEVADEQVAGEVPKAGRRHRNAPRRVKRALGRDALQQIAVRVKDVDEAVAAAGDVIVLVGVLQGKRHDQVAADVGDAEGGVALREARVGERGGAEGDRLEVRVEDVDLAAVEIG